MKSIGETLGQNLSETYDKYLMQAMDSPSLLETLRGKVIGYKDITVPRYLYIWIPTIEKHYDTDWDGEYSDFDGYLLSLKKVQLFRIGTEIVKEPIYKKQTGKKITFRRYGEVKEVA